MTAKGFNYKDWIWVSEPHVRKKASQARCMPEEEDDDEQFFRIILARGVIPNYPKGGGSWHVTGRGVFF